MLRGLRSFRGEKFSIESLSSLQRGDEKDKPIDDFESSIQNEAKLIAKSLKQEYQKYWKSLEDNLNFRFDCLSLDDESFSRNCETAKTIEELQRRVLESSGKGEEELEIVIE